MNPARQDEHSAEARAIVDAMHKLRANPEVLAGARTDLMAALDRLGLTGTPRQAIAATLTLRPEAILVHGSSMFWSI
jgi:hypothetical protein